MCPLRIFTAESLDKLRAKGHGKSMGEWYATLQPEPTAHPGDARRARSVFGGGIVAVPCPVVELGAAPAGGNLLQGGVESDQSLFLVLLYLLVAPPISSSST